jgi:hypothetical protein
VLAKPLKHLEMPEPRGGRARRRFPRAVVLTSSRGLTGVHIDLIDSLGLEEALTAAINVVASGSKDTKTVEMGLKKKWNVEACERVISPYRAHFSTSRNPPCAAKSHVDESHGHPRSRHHCSVSRCPCSAAIEQVSAFHTHSRSRAHCSTSRL